MSPGAVERLTYVKAEPRVVWATLHDPAAQEVLYPELALGPASAGWPGAAATRSGRLRLGLLRASVRIESLEARPASRFRTIAVGGGVRIEHCWTLEAGAGGGTRVGASMEIITTAGWVRRLIWLGRGSTVNVIEAHLRNLKDLVESGAGHGAPT